MFTALPVRAECWPLCRYVTPVAYNYAQLALAQWRSEEQQSPMIRFSGARFHLAERWLVGLDAITTLDPKDEEHLGSQERYSVQLGYRVALDGQWDLVLSSGMDTLHRERQSELAPMAAVELRTRLWEGLEGEARWAGHDFQGQWRSRQVMGLFYYLTPRVGLGTQVTREPDEHAASLSLRLRL
ncbi:hypothetical protein [Ferrimonas balearica]|uniref:hypothetical protein n=1 Tax=Ferrimonas balearica TaxID=44012 RepID=UPI001C998426|nr:hypothetical protein [Ferrimonas balearica]MBY5994150.1 hypothetical protein [Ferrimonas balearica]